VGSILWGLRSAEDQRTHRMRHRSPRSPTAGTARSPNSFPSRSGRIRLRRSRSLCYPPCPPVGVGRVSQARIMVKYTRDRSPHRKDAYACAPIRASPRQESRKPGKYHGNLKNIIDIAGKLPERHPSPTSPALM